MRISTTQNPVVATSSARTVARIASTSCTIWLLVIVYVVLAKLLSSTIMPITFRGTGQQSLPDQSSIGFFAVLGLVGAWCARRTGFPDAWDTRVSNRQPLLLPALLGRGFGSVAVGLDLLTAGSEAVARVTAQPWFNIDFPGSLRCYFRCL